MTVTFENPMKNIAVIVNRYVYLKMKAQIRTKFVGYSIFLLFEYRLRRVYFEAAKTKTII